MHEITFTHQGDCTPGVNFKLDVCPIDIHIGQIRLVRIYVVVLVLLTLTLKIGSWHSPGWSDCASTYTMKIQCEENVRKKWGNFLTFSTLFPHIFHTFSSQKIPHISAGNWPDSSHGKCEEKCKENVRKVNVRKIVRKMGSSKMWGKMWGNFNTFFLTISLHYFLTWTLEIGRFPHMEMWGKCEENCEQNFTTISAHGFLTLRLEKILTFVRKSVRKLSIFHTFLHNFNTLMLHYNQLGEEAQWPIG